MRAYELLVFRDMKFELLGTWHETNQRTEEKKD